MSDLAGHPEDRFSRVAAQVMFRQRLASFHEFHIVASLNVHIQGLSANYMYVTWMLCDIHKTLV